MASTTARELLLVDDEPGVLVLLKGVFERDEHLEVTTASTGEQAMAFAVEIAPDLVLLDISLPDRQGYAVCRFIKYHPNCGRMKVGADGFLHKPLVAVDLRAEVIVSSGSPARRR